MGHMTIRSAVGSSGVHGPKFPGLARSHITCPSRPVPASSLQWLQCITWT